MKQISILSIVSANLLLATAETPDVRKATEVIAPPAPPVTFKVGPARTPPSAIRAAAALYSIGDPTPEEQLYLELINRARANPNAEALRLAAITDPQIVSDYQSAGVDLNLMVQQFGSLSPAQPLAMNSKLTTAARAHSQDMFQNVFQQHDSSDGRSAFDRLVEVGFIGSAGENIYSNARSVEHGHAAFEVDWGGSPEDGGMQTPPGHRNSIHNPVFREIGIGVVLGSKTIAGNTPVNHVGPQLVTQDLGTAQNSTPFITGVAYYDLNGNNFYDMGEGIGNVKITVTPSNFEALTTRSGGYAIPVTGNGTYSVSFSGAGFTEQTRTVSVVGSKNQKVDFVPSYSAPVITGPVVASVGKNNAYSIAPVNGASAYEWRSFQKTAAAAEGAENDSARITIAQGGTYDVIQGIIVKSGLYAFHLASPNQAAQNITLSPPYLINDNSSISFQSRLGYATSDQHALVKISLDGGATWETLYKQTGDINRPETAWQKRTVSLSPYSGKTAKFRFSYEIFGRYVPSTNLQDGWLFDDIQFTGVQEIVNERIFPVTGTSFFFQPATLGDFSLQSRIKAGHEFLSWGPALSVRTAPASTELQLSINLLANGQIQIDTEVTSGTVPAKFLLETRSSVGTPWQTTTASGQSVSVTKFRFSVPKPSVTGQYYRVRGE